MKQIITPLLYAWLLVMICMGVGGLLGLTAAAAYSVFNILT